MSTKELFLDLFSRCKKAEPEEQELNVIYARLYRDHKDNAELKLYMENRFGKDWLEETLEWTKEEYHYL